MKASSIFFFFFGHVVQAYGWDLSSPTRDLTCAPCSESAESLTTELPGKFHFFISKIKSCFLLGEIRERFCCMRVQTCKKEHMKGEQTKGWTLPVINLLPLKSKIHFS